MLQGRGHKRSDPERAGAESPCILRVARGNKPAMDDGAGHSNIALRAQTSRRLPQK